jgi:hypothetical protein
VTHQRGNRSPDGKLRQRIKRFVYKQSFWDDFKRESICLSSEDNVVTFVKDFKPNYNIWDIPFVERGQVLSDQYGTGTPVYPLEPQ